MRLKFYMGGPKHLVAMFDFCVNFLTLLSFNIMSKLWSPSVFFMTEIIK